MSRHRHLFILAIATTAVFLMAAIVLAEDECIVVESRDELIKAVAEAKPGTTISIAPGVYDGGISFDGPRGSKDRPIVITGADADQPPVFSGADFGWHMADPEFVELRNLVFEKTRDNGLNIDDGGTYQTPARGVVLRRIHVRDIGSGGNHDGIKLSGVDDFRVEDCTVDRWGERGSAIDMVGCHGGSISHCAFGEGAAEANGVQMKGGSSGITLSNCRFENSGGRAVNLGGNTGLEYFRPAAQVYEAKEIVVEDCVFIGSMAAVAFVGVDGAIVRHNIFYRPKRWLLRILQENQREEFVPCRNGKFTRNIVVFHAEELATAVNVGPKTAPGTFEFAENFWYAIGAAESTRRAVKLPTVERDSLYGEDPGFVDEDHGDFSLRPDSAAREYGPRAKE